MKFKKVELRDKETGEIINNVEYCPSGHQNNLALDGVSLDDGTKLIRKEGVCPEPNCEYSEVNP